MIGETGVSPCGVVTPVAGATVTFAFAASAPGAKVTETPPVALVTVPPVAAETSVGAGGDGPLPGVDAGSGPVAVVPAGAAVVAVGFPVADPLIGLAITALILRITWASWRTVSRG
jgi:hypothetical protein